MKEYVDTEMLAEVRAAIAYPIGSIYISSTNTNPSTYFGGSWELIDKSLKYKFYNSLTDSIIFTPTDNIKEVELHVNVADHKVDIILNCETAVNFSESNNRLGTINFSKLGFSAVEAPKYAVGGSDTAEGLIWTQLASSGSWTCYDVIPKSDGNSIVIDSVLRVPISFLVSSKNMIDSFCDKFYWKRIS